MAEGGHRHPNQESYSSGHGSMDENSTHMKLMSFGAQQAPLMETNGIDLAKRKQHPEAVQSSTKPQLNQANSRLVLAERQETFRTIQSECSNLESLTAHRDIYRTQANALSAIAERQESFRTLPSELPNLDSLPITGEVQPFSKTQEYQPARLITSLTGAVTPSYNIVASIENNEAANIPVRTTSARHLSPLQSSSDNGDVENNTVSSTSRRGLNTQDSNDSRAARSVNYRRLIDDNTLIHELPLPFIKFLSSTFDRQDCKNWKDLVNLYNWNFKQITIFKNKNHPEGVFCSLLNENEFQQYNILQLKEDLQAIPRKDALEDLNKMIHEHNSAL